MKKLTKEELEKKKVYHNKRWNYYKKKIESVENEEKIIGFKIY